ncbi:MAG: hypothetical protein ACKO6N_10340 [Myxococcota bacterium]
MMIRTFKLTLFLMMTIVVMTSTHARAGVLEHGLLESGAGEDGLLESGAGEDGLSCIVFSCQPLPSVSDPPWILFDVPSDRVNNRLSVTSDPS